MSPQVSHDDLVKEREALQELIQSDGWRIFLAYVAKEWNGRGYHSRLTMAFDRGDLEAKVLHRASLEIVRLFEWPRNRVEELKGQVDE